MAHVLGTLLFVLVLWAIVLAWLWLSTAPWSGSRLWGIGALWTGMTVAFEFAFGHYVAGHSWERLLADYNLFAGRMWLLVLLSLLLAPRLSGAWLGKLAR